MKSEQIYQLVSTQFLLTCTAVEHTRPLAVSPTKLTLLSFLFALLGEFHLVSSVGSQRAPANSRAGTKPAMRSCKEN